MFILVWEYLVKSGQENAFEQTYGSRGLWVELFTKAEGYLSTELHHDTKNPRRYLTIDQWASEQLYQSFLQQYQNEYQAIDTQCAELTVSESFLRQFVLAD